MTKVHTGNNYILWRMCRNIAHDYKCGISEQWTNRTPRKRRLGLGMGGCGVTWMDSGCRNGIPSEHAVCGIQIIVAKPKYLLSTVPVHGEAT